MLTDQGKLNWVRGVAGKARDAVLGSRPARAVKEGYNTRAEDKADLTEGAADSVIEGYKPEVSPPPAWATPRKSRVVEPDIQPDISRTESELDYSLRGFPPKSPKLSAGRALKNILGFLRPARGVVTKGAKSADRLQPEENHNSNADLDSNTGDVTIASEVSPTPPKNPVNPLKLAGEAWKFIWHWRHFIVAGILFAIAWGFMHKVVSFVTCPFGGILWCASDNDDAALENERTNTRVAELESQVGALSAQLAENSANDRRRVDHVIAEANQELAHAVEADDFEGAYSIYRRAYDGVWNDLDEPTGEPDPAARGPEPLPRAIASPV